MNFSYKWLQSYFKKSLPAPKKLAEILTMGAFEIEEIKKSGKDYILDIDVLPNRGSDCFSHIGIAREITAMTNLDFLPPISKIKEDKKIKARNFVSVNVRNKDDCQRYTLGVVADVKVGPSPKWIQDRLKVCGLRPINNIVDITNYVMLETGQPLHAFDFDKIKSVNPKSQIPNPKQIPNSKNQKQKKIIVRRAKNREKITTLDDKTFYLDEDVLVIADSKMPLAIAGIKGGKGTEIDKGTKTIVLESANFNSELIRQASRKLNLKTDASWRFEHKIDPNLTETAVKRASYLIQNIAPARIASGLVDFYPKKVLPKRIKLNLNYTERLLGIKISKKEIKNIFKRLNFKIKKEQASKIEVEIPSSRLDLSIPEDLIEEIGRIYGFQNIPAVFPEAALIPPKRNFVIFWKDEIKDILKELGFSEVYNCSFIGKKQANIFGYLAGKIIEIENPMSVEQRYLRPSLMPNLLRNVKENFKCFDRVKIFELGKIFLKKSGAKNKKQIKEQRMLAGVLASKEAKTEYFYQLKGAVDSLTNKLGISDVWYDDYKQRPEESELAAWNLDKSAEIKIGQEKIGFFGEISPSILKNLEIKGKIVLFDIDFEKLIKLCSEEQEYQPISQFPAAVRDLAVLVPPKVKVVNVLNKINAIGGPLIRDVDLFDIYEGEEIPNGKKNLAFRLIYQAENRTLDSKEIDKIQNRIIKELEKDPDWEVRK